MRRQSELYKALVNATFLQSLVATAYTICSYIIYYAYMFPEAEIILLLRRSSLVSAAAA